MKSIWERVYRKWLLEFKWNTLKDVYDYIATYARISANKIGYMIETDSGEVILSVQFPDNTATQYKYKIYQTNNYYKLRLIGVAE